jgi:hypothetical protein
MVSDNFEDKIRSKLEQRTINPSENSWAKLARKLDEEQNTKKNKTKWWIGIAASLVGGLLVFLFYFNKSEPINTATEIVKEPQNESLKEPNSQIVIQNNSQEKENKDFLEGKTEPLYKDNTVKTRVELKQKTVKVTQGGTQSKVAKQDKLVNPNHNTQVESNAIGESDFTQLNSIQSKSEIEKALNSEVDRLLREAQEDIALSNTANAHAISVNSERLLNEVEMEIEQSFREKILKKIISGYDSVKTAIAQRND